jgi:endonuclease/exonuclease/phosphatase family metal-dependent hydrolase
VIRVVSWNVLADAYVRDEYYPNADPAAFDRPKRRRRIAERLAAYANVDAICLQEVDGALFFAAEEALPRSTGRLLCKRGREEGCAMFIRKDVAPEPAWRELVFTDLSGHVALGASVAGVSVVTTHLKWESPTTPPGEHRGIAQLAELLDVWASAPRIVCGDFNADPTSEVLALARARGLIDAYASMNDAFTANSNQRKKRIDFILHSADLTATPSPIPPISDDTPLPSNVEPSDHLAIEALVLTGRSPRGRS